MKLRLVLASVVVACLVGAALWPSASPAVANSQVVTVATAVMPLGVGDQPPKKFEYVGNKACKMCHIKQHKSWAKTKMAGALESLMPGKDVEIKKKHNLDPQKDYTKDKSCLKCHVTGFEEKGGYAIPDPADEKAVKKAEDLANVGCEACHGPGSEYAKLHKEIKKAKRTYKDEEMCAVGMKKFDKDMCVNCHNEKSPTVNKEAPFKFEEDKNKDTHEHLPLKQHGK
ncbi:MAG: cytochrome c family protein [Phycisphaerae bacterium]|nr:cytochrome c family protein [Phycisphaerae bacterium]